MADYRAISDQIAADIAEGRLKPGERLPPQRQFAFERGIAVSTASRVYAELTRLGLVAGEVGRGTYVRPFPASPDGGLAEAASVNLEHVFAILPDQAVNIAASLNQLIGPEAVRVAFPPVNALATPHARSAAAAFFARGGWAPDPAGVLFTGTGRQGIAAAMAALAPPGGRIGVEAMTYPIVKSIAARLGITLVPIAMDADGMRPEAVEEACRNAPLCALYLQPSLQSPLGTTMSAARRNAIARTLERQDLICIEDAIYSFLTDDEPLARRAPDRVILVDSLSKRVAPGTTLGFIATPPHLTDRVARTIRNGAWSVTGLPLAIALHMMGDGLAARIGQAKRSDAAKRQTMARDILVGLDVRGDSRAYHLWLTLPDPWRAENFAAAAARHRIAIAPASVFAIEPDAAPNGVRLALGSPSFDSLRGALETLYRLILHGDDRQVE
ncbi:MAG TPA: PLP-dependent aminotransferase family protein [Methylobacterium sp.]